MKEDERKDKANYRYIVISCIVLVISYFYINQETDKLKKMEQKTEYKSRVVEGEQSFSFKHSSIKTKKLKSFLRSKLDSLRPCEFYHDILQKQSSHGFTNTDLFNELYRSERDDIKFLYQYFGAAFEDKDQLESRLDELGEDSKIVFMAFKDSRPEKVKFWSKEIDRLLSEKMMGIVDSAIDNSSHSILMYLYIVRFQYEKEGDAMFLFDDPVKVLINKETALISKNYFRDIASNETELIATKYLNDLLPLPNLNFLEKLKTDIIKTKDKGIYNIFINMCTKIMDKIISHKKNTPARAYLYSTIREVSKGIILNKEYPRFVDLGFAPEDYTNIHTCDDRKWIQKCYKECRK